MRTTMRQTILICLICLSARLLAQLPADHLQGQGLIGELVYYRATAENHAIRIFNHKYLPDLVKSEMISRYDRLRVDYDQLILQLIADLHGRKRLGYFKKLDKYFREGKSCKNKNFQTFLSNWNSIQISYEDMIAYPTRFYMDSLTAEYKDLKNQNLGLQEEQQKSATGPIKINPLDPIGSAGSLFSVYKRFAMTNEFKVANITELLGEMRLKHPAELIADEEELINTKIESR